MDSLASYATTKLEGLAQASLKRDLSCTARAAGVIVERNSRRVISFSCNDYLNLTQHPAIVSAAREALDRYGLGAGASRLVTGNHPLYAELETRLAGKSAAKEGKA